MTHYIYGSGEHGCLYDNGPHYVESIADAVEDLACTFELDARRRAQLKRDLYLELRPRQDGADYCDINPCDCDTPSDHDVKQGG